MRAALAGVVALCAVNAAATEPAATAGGRAAWVGGGELDLVGDLWADLAFPLGSGSDLYFAVDSRTTIRKTLSDFAFEVRDLEYGLELGWRVRPAALGGDVLLAWAGQRGREFVDADGQPFVRYVAAGYESAGARFGGLLAAGPVIEDREVEADAVVFGEARGRLFGAGFAGAWVGFDVELDSLVRGDDLLADVAAGPRLALLVTDGLVASLFVHYQRSRNPLGLLDDAWLFGFSYEEEPRAEDPAVPPDIDGLLAFGSGAGRLSGELLLRFLSPPFLDGTRGVVLVDGNILTADDTGDLYYLYHVGIEHPTDGWLYGAWFYHRSNHQLAEPNRSVTSLNVIEAGIESAERYGAARRRGPGITFDGWLRLGYLLDSSFGEDERAHARGGVRLALPWGGARLVPYALAAGEAGDVLNAKLGLGTTVGRQLEIEVEFRSDDQLFARDSRVLLCTARYRL